MIKSLHATFSKSTGVTTDTRNIQSGNIFFALKGPSFNGNDFAEQALNEGCAFAIVDELKPELESDNRYIKVDDALKTLQELATFHRSKLRIPIIALTGSNGKTTTKELIHAALAVRYKCFSTKGNLNNHIGVPLSLLSITKRHEIAVIEMGANHQKEIDFLCSIAKPEYGLITNIGLAHLEGFGGEEGIYKGKKELFDFLIKTEGRLFVNEDDKKVVKAAGSASYIGYGIAEDAVYRGEYTVKHDKLLVNWWRKERPFQKFDISTNLTGSYNFTNVLCAVTVARYFGVSQREIKQGLQAYDPKNQRSQLEETERDNTVIVDCYNANPSSMRAALENLKVSKHAKKVVILGDMLELGDDSDKHHSEILTLVEASGVDQVILVGEHFKKASKGKDFITMIETAEAAEYISKNPVSESFVLLKGSRKKKLETLLELL